MDWDEATTLGAKAARLIADLSLIFEKISDGGYVVTPPAWKSVRRVLPRSTRQLVTIELDDHLQIAKVFEPDAVDGLLELVGYTVPEGHTVVGSVRVRHEFDVDLGPGERVEVPPDIGPGPTTDPGIPMWVTPLDRHTCSACAFRHGLPYLKDAVQATCTKTEEEGGCRCVVKPSAITPRPNSNKSGG